MGGWGGEGTCTGLKCIPQMGQGEEAGIIPPI